MVVFEPVESFILDLIISIAVFIGAQVVNAGRHRFALLSQKNERHAESDKSSENRGEVDVETHGEEHREGESEYADPDQGVENPLARVHAANSRLGLLLTRRKHAGYRHTLEIWLGSA